MTLKEEIITLLINQVHQELEQAQKAAQESKDHVTQDDMKQEGKYDTRRTEASYLAGALARRVTELENDLNLLKALSLRESSNKVIIGSLVRCLHEDNEVLIFISPASGGKPISIQGKSIQVTSPRSPLGDAILAMEEGDYFEVESPKGELEYEILEVI